MKKILLFLMFAMFCIPWAANAQTTVTIGDLETATDNTYLPMNSLYEYSYSQQIYTADEIGTAGTITAITIWMYGAEDLYEIPFDIYMVETDKESFTSTSDWVAVTSGDIVYSGSVTVHNTEAQAYTFTLTSPFTYSGTGNLLIAFDNNCGQWKGGLNGKVFAATDGVNRSIYARRDSQDYDPTNMSSISANGLLATRNVIEIDITPSGGPTCERPDNLEVSNITGYGADFAWTGTVGNYTFEYKKASETDWTVVTGLTATNYTLSNLESWTAYNTRVKAVCGTDFESGYKTANFTTLEVCPDGKICIGQGTATNSYLPTYNYYNYSLTEQIYTAEEIGQAGAILSLDIYSVGTVTRNLEFYMVSTTKETFADGTDWIAATASDLVYNGSVTFAANSWNTITLDDPFIYDGNSNVALIVRDMTGSYESSINFFVFDAPSQAIRIYRDGSPYDLAAPGEGTVMDVKNRVRLVVGEPPACPKPTGVTVNYEGGTEATISWTSDATAWNIDVNGTVTAITENPYTLTGLELSTDYEVKVQAECGDAESEWTNPVSFTTDACMPEDQCSLTFVLADSYGDSWNGASIGVYDYTGEELGDLLASVTIETGLGAGVEQTTTLTFCNGQELAIFWTSGSYDGEVSYTVTDLNGDVVVDGEGEGFDAFAYQISCVVTDCRKPTNFVASEIANHSVVLSWTENGPATEWQIAYISENDEEVSYITTTENPYTLTGLEASTMYAAQVTPVCEVEKPSEVIYWTTDVACPAPTELVVNPLVTSAEISWNGFAETYDLEWSPKPTSTVEGSWLQYDNGTMQANVGSSTAGVWTWGVKYPSTMLNSNNTLSKIAFYEVDNSYYTDGTVTVKIYSGGDSVPATLLYTETIATEGTNGMREVTLSSPVQIDASSNLWITLTANATYCMTMSNQDGGVDSRWFNNSGNWVDFGTLYTAGAAYSFMIRGYIESIDWDAVVWTTESNVTSPTTLNDLSAESEYLVRVKANCGGEDGESIWSHTYFTTASACDAPNTLAAEVNGTTATLSWNAYQDSYTLRYRPASAVDPTAPATIILEANDVWEDGSGYMMLLDADTTAYGTLWNANHYIFVDGEQYSGGDLPASYFDEFEYKVPTGANGSLNDSINVVITGSVTLQIPAGTYDYVIFNPTPDDRFYIAADNGEVPCAGDNYVFEPGVTYHFTMQRFGSGDGAAFEITRPMSDWILVENVNTPYELTGLTPKTAYEWQVQGVNCDGEGHNTDWTEIQHFTTPELTGQTIALVQGINYFSTSFEITLNELKAALLEALPNTAITIQSQNQSASYNPSNHRWTGRLNTLDLTSMHIITVASACEITLTGTPIDLSTFSATINANGATYLAFPFNESMTLTDAFAGFAYNQDVVQSQTLNAKYNRGRWQGQLSTLDPGKGYIYQSAKSESRTFTYPTGTSKVAQSSEEPMVTVLSKQVQNNTKELNLMPKAQKSFIKSNHKFDITK